ncbi:hypothetical protein B0T26DRAFT_675035 [Lasiosphaeria miniovina]|uniref:F-box domain-containing protein n=1 Tax=Lasiosphaeria miniovina TaxID=1954250 RepID=A0AA40AWU0_9PEZI|nr:uncharacterized protein B0T26DRAFT_675035 [Lasiosphaeria miniovina]KAK0723467.1 hypothetical protein B0T26DRAFT_675035 [Lasiosphaeria miniovina]
MGISKLPTEMILAIMKYLPEESVKIDWRQYVYCDVREELIRWDWASGNGDSARCCNYHVRPRLFGTNMVTVRLVMNRYFYGGENGLPLSVLHRDSVDKDAGTGVQVRYSWRARIIDHDLFVHGTFTIKYPAGDHTALRRYMKRFKRDLLSDAESQDWGCDEKATSKVPDHCHQEVAQLGDLQDLSGQSRRCCIGELLLSCHTFDGKNGKILS